MSWSAVGVDAGGTKIAAARVSDGTIEALERRPTPVTSAAAVVDAIAAAVAEVHRPGLPIGVAIAGQVDRRAGVVLSSPNLPGCRVPIAAALQDRFAVPVLVDNDVTLAAFGELGQLDVTPAVLVSLFLGTGIGAGAVIGGVPLAGAHNLAAEAGHATFRPGGELCNCGREGCFEAYAGGLAILRRAR
ncbi:MAG: ROK family protein, partial [Acidobacteria bacterium]|nr:ROK family protein [Acidobacteriota bacterium]